MKRLLASVVLASVSLAQVNLSGAGATFPAPLYTEYYIPAFQKANSGVRVNYQAVGSGAGIRQFGDKVVSFGATDAPLSDQQLTDIKKATGSDVLHIPAALGPVVLTYNLPQIAGKEIRLDAATLSAIMLGKVLRWNDKRIQDLNPDVKLPTQLISAVHRSDGSGTTFIFTNYLSAISADWKTKVGAGQSVNWPAFSSLGGRGNAGVAALVSQTPGALGYVELKYALENKLPMVTLRNASGNWIKPSLAAAVEATSGIEMPADLRLNTQVVNTKDPQGYPIVGMTWLLVYQEQNVSAKNLEQAKALQQYLRWVLSDGQAQNEKASYVRLSSEVVRRASALVDSMTFGGKPIK
jgi:phosphate transport system substrate-binding protein